MFTPGIAAATVETLAESFLRTKGLVQFSGVMCSEILAQGEMLAAADAVEATNKMAFFVSRTAADVEVGGKLDLLRSGNRHKSRGLFYGGSTDELALLFMAAYAGRGLSVNFSGSKTTSTMHLKDLLAVDVDTSITQALLDKCQAAGVDVYCSLEGVAKVFCSGKNKFFDQVYNQMWFIGALEIAGFNYLAKSATKIPQTEDGISGLKGAYRKVCEQAVANLYLAPGAWTSSTTFGIQEDFIGNIGQVGYYIYSAPIALQSQADREDRKAPIVQIAAKESGAVHSSIVLVNINA